ncbi:putative Transcriptional regulator, TetR family [[Clostridium] ultunense Esp]|uniref:Putative Transcriptional regulator, TetR family n=1 Tax=[Clostridium] ultunense Esp TaxID=1288971 RepID=M1ZFU2_9FIRM|nr:TetR/AcrR family transcriptional regulator [Schnuerera ultunensis]CCQ92577.1 putative Transcriptional regulator, TetR family [[Clostridium] ultunense Esp]SHD77731.1 putative Transcriptional regulator, TetR family [[Clostridium] ultunense Esp]
MPKIVDYESKKQEIIEKARIVFAKRGYHNTNLSHISKKCGIGRTTLYQYFANKDEIFYHTMGSTLEEIKSQVNVIVLDEQLTFVEKLKEIIHKLTEEQKHNNTFILLLEVWLVLKRENNETLEKLKEYTRELKRILEELIKEAINAKEIKPIDSKSLAETIYTFIETFTLQRTSNYLDSKVKVESLNLLIDGLKA